MLRGRQRGVRWLEANLQFVASEMASGEPGFETIVSRLADILVVQAVRAHLAQTGGGCKGWLKALIDPQIIVVGGVVARNGGDAFLAAIEAFAAAVLGGIGIVPGAMLGGLFLGLLENLGIWKLPSEWQSAISFGVIVTRVAATSSIGTPRRRRGAAGSTRWRARAGG